MKISYKLEGTPNSPVLIFSNSLGAEMMMWDELIPYLLPYFRVLRYNTNPLLFETSDVTVDDLGNQVISLMNDLNVDKAYFCGLSMGGLIGQSLAIHHESRFYKIAISNTAVKIGTIDTWNERIQIVTNKGFDELSEMMMERWFTDDYRKYHTDRVNQIKEVFKKNDPELYIKNCKAIGNADFTDHLSKIGIPVLVLTGDQDPVTTVAQAEFLSDHIQQAECKILPAKHLSGTELPLEFASALIDFFVGKNIDERGMHVRRTVLGNAHVDRSISNLNEFNQDFQSFITRYAWGDVWSRPGLSKHDRSLITLAMLIALNRKDEFKMHIKAALNNGVSKDVIKEVILQSALYCGLPAANEAIHSAQEIFNS